MSAARVHRGTTVGRRAAAVSIVGRAGVRLRHHGDFDEAGVQILRDLENRYDALPWRFDTAALCEALGPRASQPQPTRFEVGVRDLSGVVVEELVIEELLADLHTAGCAQ